MTLPVVFGVIPFLYLDQMKNIIALCALLAVTAGVSSRSYAQSTETPQFSHSTIYVTDLNTAVSFYKDVMLLPVMSEPFHDGRHVWFRVGPHSQIHVVSGAKVRIAHDINIHTAFTVKSVEAFMKHLDAVGQKYGNWTATSTAIQLRNDGVKQIYFQDPDGYWIEVNDDKE